MPDAKDLAAVLEPEQGWETLKSPEIVKFEKLGDTISGVLLAVTTVQVKGKGVVEYMLGRGSDRLKLLGTYDLVQKLNRTHVGYPVRIKYRGEDPSISRNGNAMKIFDVQVKKQRDASFADGSPITDEDIPF